MTSFYDVTIVCSIILAGKPLHMHRQTAEWSSAYLPASTPINHFNQKYEMSSFHFRTHFHACDIYIYISMYIKYYNVTEQIIAYVHMSALFAKT